MRDRKGVLCIIMLVVAVSLPSQLHGMKKFRITKAFSAIAAILSHPFKKKSHSPKKKSKEGKKTEISEMSNLLKNGGDDENIIQKSQSVVAGKSESSYSLEQARKESILARTMSLIELKTKADSLPIFLPPLPSPEDKKGKEKYENPVKQKLTSEPNFRQADILKKDIIKTNYVDLAPECKTELWSGCDSDAENIPKDEKKLCEKK